MKDVFENIKERLKEKKDLVPVNRLLDDIINDKPLELGQLMAYAEAIEIVNQVAEEYKNPEQVNDCCEWTYGDDVADAVTDIYDTKCGNMHMFIGGSPSDNKYKYCPYCGKKIKVVE